MPRQLPVTFADTYAQVSEELKRRLGDAQAAQMGPPVASDIAPAGDRERVRAWNARNPEATDAAMLQLAQQKYAEHTASGLPPEQAVRATAEDLTLFRYGQRLALYTYGQPDSSSQVKEAERISKLAKRESTPDPQPPAPTMPSAALTNAVVASPPPAASVPAEAPPLEAPTLPNGTLPMLPSDRAAPPPPGGPLR